MAPVRQKIKLPARRGRTARIEGRRYRANARGYTLLELVVALAIMASVLTLAGVNGVRMLERYQEQIKFREIRSDIALSRYRALAERRRILIGAGALEVDLPPNWEVSAPAPVVYTPSGVCLGGAVTIRAPSGRTETWQLEPPECKFGNEQSAP